MFSRGTQGKFQIRNSNSESIFVQARSKRAIGSLALKYNPDRYNTHSLDSGQHLGSGSTEEKQRLSLPYDVGDFPSLSLDTLPVTRSSQPGEALRAN